MFEGKEKDHCGWRGVGGEEEMMSEDVGLVGSRWNLSFRNG